MYGISQKQILSMTRILCYILHLHIRVGVPLPIAPTSTVTGPFNFIINPGYLYRDQMQSAVSAVYQYRRYYCVDLDTFFR